MSTVQVEDEFYSASFGSDFDSTTHEFDSDNALLSGIFVIMLFISKFDSMTLLDSQVRLVLDLLQMNFDATSLASEFILVYFQLSLILCYLQVKLMLCHLKYQKKFFWIFSSLASFFCAFINNLIIEIIIVTLLK